MPSRKQRRRREKLQRHEWELVEIDEQGHETPLERAAVAKKEEKPRARGAAASRGRRPVREVKPPSWSRSAKRAALFAPVLYIFLSFGKHAPALPVRVAIALAYAAAFVPMFFFVDRLAYRAYRRRTGSTGSTGS
jgi:hypothetical protein